MSPVSVDMPPVLYRSHSGKVYGVAGSVWVELPEGTTFEQLSEYMSYKPRKPLLTHDEKRWTVKGSKGNHYTVRLKSGQYTCTCAGFGWRRKCKHIEGIKNADG